MTELFAKLGFRTRATTRRPAPVRRTPDRRSARAAAAGAAVDPQAQIAAAIELARKNPIVALPQDFVLLGRVLATLGGLIVRYRPKLDLATAILPALTRAMVPNAA